jgi:uncharacterized protein YhbP (UPF0306 family)
VAATPADDLRERVARYLRSHHTMTLATMGAPASDPTAGAGRPGLGAEDAPGEPPVGSGPTASAVPHAASVFYAVDDALRLIFLSKTTSSHGRHIETSAAVAVTVTEQYDDWELIQGVQFWGTAKRLRGAAKAAAMAVYLRRFPFVRESMDQPRLAETLRTVAVYRVEPERVAFTDNTTGVFGREVLDLKG